MLDVTISESIRATFGAVSALIAAAGLVVVAAVERLELLLRPGGGQGLIAVQ